MLIALTILSTFVYVTQIINQTPKVQNEEYNQLAEYQQGLRNTLISSLASITNGGNNEILTTNINKLNQIMSTHFYQVILQNNYKLNNIYPYQEGVWVSWNQNNYGVSAVSAQFTLNSIGTSNTVNSEFSITIKTEVTLTGNYLQINETAKQANLSVSLQNEGAQALARNMDFYYQKNNEWIQTVASIANFGDGTYDVNFIAELNQSSDPLIVQIRCEDQRGIIVNATTRCA